MNQPIKPYKKSTGGGKSNIIFALLLAILFLMPTLGAKAQTSEPYVVLKDGTATFYYNSSKPEGALPIQSKMDDANWPTEVRESVVKVVFDNSFKDYKPTSCAYWFCRYDNLTEFSGIKDNLNTSEVTDMHHMFFACERLSTLDLSNFNTENVTNMRLMFCEIGCATLDLSNFNTEKVTNMSYMFEDCRCKQIDLSSFNTQNVENMDSMFVFCSRLETIYVGDGWTMSSVKKADWLFDGCFYLFGGKGTQCNPYQHQSRGYACIDGGSEDPGYFTRKGTIKEVSIEISGTSKSDYLLGEVLDFGERNISVTFAGMSPTSVPLAIEYCNYDNTKLGKQTVYVDFQGAHTSFEINITDNKGAYSEFDSETGILTLYYCKYRDGLRHISNDLCEKPAKVKKVIIDPSIADYIPTDCSYWFENFVNLTEIEGLNYLNTSEVTSMYEMFENCNKITSLDLSSFDTYQVKRMDGMFARCSNLQTIYVGSEWSTHGLGDYAIKYQIFNDCVNLKGGMGTTYDEKHINGYYARIDDGSANPGYFTYKASTPISSIPDTQTDVKVWSFNNTIYLETLPDTKYTIIDLNGRVIKSATTKSSHEEISITKSGVYIVLVNGESYKVSVN